MNPARVRSEAVDECEVYLTPDGLLVIDWCGVDLLSEELALRVCEVHVRLAEGRKLPTIVDMRGVGAVDRGARDVGSGEAVTAVVERLAMMVDGPLSEIIGNFFIRLSRPAYPTRLFRDERAAREWLGVPGEGA